MKTERFYLSIIVILFTIAWFFVLSFHAIPVENRDLLTTASGIFLGAGWTLVLNWWFSSSKGSADKSEKLNETNKTKFKDVPEL